MINFKQISMKMTIVLGLFMPFQMIQAVELSLDNSIALNLANDVNYDLSDDEVKFNILDPVVCHKESPTTSAYAIEIVDPNGQGVFMPLISNIGYNVPSQLIKVQVNSADGVCATKGGSSFSDFIFTDSFEDIEVIPDFRYEGIGEQVVRNQSLDYTVIIENNEDFALDFTLVEYVSSNPFTNDSFFESVDNWECINHNVNNVDCNETDLNNILNNASIPSGESITLDVSRTVGSNSLIGQPVEILTAMFITNELNEIVDVKVISASPTVVENAAPSINWKDDVVPQISFIEDTPLELNNVDLTQRISFEIYDETGLNMSDALITDSISIENGKLEIVNIEWNLLNSLYSVDVDLLPVPNEYTTSDEDIVIQVQDEFGSFSGPISTDFEILPLNDPPSFDLACSGQNEVIVIRPTPIGGQLQVECVNNAAQSLSTQGSYLFDNLIDNLTNGDSGANQLVDARIINETGIFQGVNSADISLENFLTDLMVDVNSVTGMGTFQIEVFDNGTPNGEQDVCPAGFAEHCNMVITPTITVIVEDPVYFVSGEVNGLPSNQRIIMEMIDVNAQSSLETLIVQNGQNKFNFSAPLVDQTEFMISIISQPLDSSWTCEFIANNNVVIQDTINAANINDVVIDCSEVP